MAIVCLLVVFRVFIVSHPFFVVQPRLMFIDAGLTHLTTTSHWCKDELNTKLKIAKQVLTTAQLTQTMETEKEKGKQIAWSGSVVVVSGGIRKCGSLIRF